MVDYWELNKAGPPLHAALPSVADLVDRLSQKLGTYHFAADLANAFFSMDIASESQDQFAFTWEAWQWGFTVLLQGCLHSPTLFLRLVQRTWHDDPGLKMYTCAITLIISC